MFADASEHTMCAVAFLRSHQNDQPGELGFVIGKCRVAPMRHLSIPRLELQAAMLSVRLKDQIVKELDMPIANWTMWTDSTTVLQWIHSAHRKQQVFVANRVAEILDSTDVTQWKHVSGINNPADIGTRKITMGDLQASEWLTGPAWLKRPISDWPEQVPLIYATDEEDVSPAAFSASVKNCPIVDWERFSKFSTLTNTVAYLQRVFSRNKPKETTLAAEELDKARNTIFRLIQEEQFPSEMKNLRADKPLSKDSKILEFAPFIDSQGLIRAKGRLGKSNLDFSTKHPLLLHWKHYAVELFLRFQHESNAHEGTEYLRNLIQQQVWNIGIRNALRSIRVKCVRCRKGNVQTMKPMMSDLPEQRLCGNFPFANVGVDYFGPLIVKIGRRTEKRWCCLFTCLVVRAVHLEVVPKLDTDSCLNAIARFIARRGQPLTIISDNGTNFVGAEREFREYVSSWNKEYIAESLAQKGVKWTFNPPASPHFGGPWERMVRSCKQAMYSILGNQSLTEEVLQTTLCLIEQTLNGRPLTPVSSDVKDLEALTPNHFLLGKPSLCLPILPYAEDYLDHRKAFRQSQAYADTIWNRFRKEYLPTLNRRQKWKTGEEPGLQEGQLVWLVEDSDKRGFYKMARVVHLTRGRDGIARSATVRTKDGEFQRPVVKLAPVLQPDNDVFLTENRAGDVGAELKN